MASGVSPSDSRFQLKMWIGWGAIRFTFSIGNVNRMAPQPIYNLFWNCKSDAGHLIHTHIVFSDAASPLVTTQTSNYLL